MNTPAQNERDKSLDSSKKASIIVIATIALIPLLWFIFGIATKNSPYHQ